MKMSFDELQHLIDTAVKYHQAGQYKQAENIYSQVLSVDPENFDALHLSGVLAHQTGKHQLAVTLIEKAILKDKTHPSAFNNLGEAYRSLGRLTEAERCFLQAIHLKPDYFEAYSNLGNTLGNMGRLEEAASSYRHAISIRPEHFGPYNNLGNVLLSLGRLDEALTSLQTSLSICPDYAEGHNNLGNVFMAMDLPEKAEQAYRRAIALKPGFAMPYNNLGKIFIDRGQMKEGLEAYYTAIALQPDYVEAYYNLGTTYQENGELQDAERAFLSALAIDPDHGSSQWNLSLIKLLQGEYDDGWRLYEKRFVGGDRKVFEKMNHILCRLHGYARWQGEPLQDRSLLVIAEQGLGDNLMMMRYLTLLVRQAPRQLIVCCEPPLIRLFQNFPGVDRVVSMPELPFGSFDLYCPTMSLPYLFRTRLDSIPNQVPYITIPEAVKQLWRSRLAAIDGLKVGLVWAGKGTYAKNRVRSISLQQFGPLLEIDGPRFFSLQKGDGAGQWMELGWDIVDYMDECADLLDTAALVGQLDLVISVDTSVAHLAGALGKTVWLLNRFGSEWRWLLDREDSPWYPTMRIFRQEQQEGWTDVIKRIADALVLYCEDHKARLTHNPQETPQTLFEQGMAFMTAGDYCPAERCYRKALELDPHSIAVTLNLGYVIGEQGRYDESLQCYTAVLAMDPGNAHARYNRAIHLLRNGDFKGGFTDYEARLNAITDLDPRSYPQPMWDGSPLNGRSILVYAEQGLGDTIMFSRYVPILAQLGGRVILEVQQPLVSLLSGLTGVYKIIPRSSTVPATDCYVRLLSLPHILQTTLESIPCQIPYLAGAQQQVAAWRERIGDTGSEYRVGLVWACKGRPLPNRTCPPEFLAPILELPLIRWFSLQVGEKDRFPLPDTLQQHVVDFADDFADFADTAACVMNLDLVITVDAAVAHLAGALGKPVWLMLPKLSDWRWLLDRDESPWYPTMKIFRQPTEGDWSFVIDAVTLALRKELGRHPVSPTEDLAEVTFQEALGCIEREQAASAIDLLRGLISSQPDSPALWFNLGRAYEFGDHAVEAAQCYRQALVIHPDSQAILYRLAGICMKQLAWKEAEIHLSKAHELMPHSLEILLGFGKVMFHQNKMLEAMHCCRKALSMQPDYAPAIYNMALLQLQAGEYASGFANYESRFKNPELKIDTRSYLQRRWDGSALDGKSILVVGEQGLGDVIQFSRYVPMLAEMGARVTFEVDAPLVPLLTRLHGAEQVVPLSAAPPLTDLYIHLLSLPHIFGTTLETVPGHVPYLYADPAKIAAWQQLLADDKCRRIGLAWRGNPHNPTDRERSCPLMEFAPLAHVEGVSFYSLQVGSGADAVGASASDLQLVDHTDRLTDFSETAALIANLDLVISVDTAVAHLAGALGKPTWVLVAHKPEWRWLDERSDSPWYPTARIFRQPKPGAWRDVIDMVGKTLMDTISLKQPAEISDEELLQRALAALEQKAPDSAIDILNRLLVTTPDSPALWFNLGRAYELQKRTTEAKRCYKKALRLHPDSPAILYCLGRTCIAQLAWTEAETHLAKAHALMPQSTDILRALGNTKEQLGQLDAAIACCREILDFNPTDFVIKLNMSRLQLRSGNYVEGFANYDARLEIIEYGVDPRVYSQRRWDGSALDGKSILVVGEQGLGDVIQFSRYIPMLAEMGARVTFEVDAPLVPLLTRLHGAEQVVPLSAAPPLTDLYIHLLSLPHIFGTTLETVPGHVPYLYADPAKIAAWQQLLADDKCRRIGLAWRGNPHNPTDRERSCPLMEFAPLAHVEGVSFYSLQVGSGADAVGASASDLQLVDHTDRLTDFSETAALIANLDLVISVDTAVAHLAGALGKPTWVLVAHKPEWRWLDERSDSPWYPTARIFRQPKPGDWRDVILLVKNSLGQLIGH